MGERGLCDGRKTERGLCDGRKVFVMGERQKEV